MKIKIGVIFGGNSVEHEISIISALWALGFINEEKYEIVPLYITKKQEWYTGKALLESKNFGDIPSLLKKCKNVILVADKGRFFLQNKKGFKTSVAEIEIAFPIVHGTNVEDGVLQGHLETIGIPFVGSNVLASAVGQDKVIMKQIFASGNLPIVPYLWFFDAEYIEDEQAILNQIDELGYPVIVKPAELGSSIGITKAKNKKEVIEAIETACTYSTKVVVEKCVDNLMEVNCSVMGNYQNYSYSTLEEVMGKDEILSYQDKYVGNTKTKGGAKRTGMASAARIIPARISAELQKAIEETAIKATRLINSSGVVRIDFLINKETEEYFINEINSIPGDLAFWLWPNKNPEAFVEELIQIAVKNAQIKKKKTFSFDTNILQSIGNLNGTKGKIKISDFDC